MKRFCTFIFFSIVLAQLPVVGQKKNAGKNTGKATISEKFDAYIQSALPQWKSPGISVAVVKDNQVVFKKGYGVADISGTASFAASTLSVCASTTKAMTAVCMGMLVDEGKLKWTDKVSDVYPAFKLYDNYAINEVTIKDLFTHNAGLGNADWLWVFDYSIDTIINRLRLIKPAYSLRSSFIYQNIMYMVAGEVIHHVSGQSWDKFITERLFRPLGMEHTYPDYSTSKAEPGHITPHVMFEDSIIKRIPYIESKSVDAAGGVWSCADDMAKWMLFLLDSARVNNKALLRPQTYAEIFATQVIVPVAEFYPTAALTKPHFTTYGLGWFQHDYKDKMVQFHTGSLDGAVAIIGLIPENNFGIYIFGNLDHTEIRHALMYKAMDLWVFGDDNQDWSSDFYTLYKGIGQNSRRRVTDYESRRVQGTKPSLDLKAYAGKYTNEVYGEAEIITEGDSLLLKLPNSISAGLAHWNYDVFMARFKYDWFGKIPIQFSLNWLGNIRSFELDGNTYSKMPD